MALILAVYSIYRTKVHPSDGMASFQTESLDCFQTNKQIWNFF